MSASAGSAWTLASVGTARGVDVVVTLDLDGLARRIVLGLDRAEARAFARAILAAAGDAVERTFVQGHSPNLREGGHG